ncbi:MAG: DUF4928 family protein [Chloroflexi bacterium]|nr:DUF4928 family protein [Chloroflexota bacterium]
MMNQELERRLLAYSLEHKLNNKGALSVMLHVTRVARNEGLPLDANSLLTGEEGQVRGLSGPIVQAILGEYNVTKKLSSEGGRTSRGSLAKMQRYVRFLNQLYEDDLADLPLIEQWWVNQVMDFFASKPFILRYDVSRTLYSIIRDLLEQALTRQKSNPGTTYIGTVLQHLVGAKLELAFAGKNIEILHHGASVADAPTARSGDFLIKRTAIHVTTHPTLALMEKCKENLATGLKPIIVTIHNQVKTAEVLTEAEAIFDRVEILPAEQFLAANVYELSGFDEIERDATVEQLIRVYNGLIDQYETDPSLHINIGK